MSTHRILHVTIKINLRFTSKGKPYLLIRHTNGKTGEVNRFRMTAGRYAEFMRECVAGLVGKVERLEREHQAGEA